MNSPQMSLRGQHSHAIQTKHSNLDVFNQNETNPDESSVCQIHETEKAIYFTIDQPSVKLCKQCALNKALCGHQIQKCFDQTQFQKKESLKTLMDGIKGLINDTQKENKYLVAKISDIRNRYDREIGPSIQAIDQLIKQLTKIRQNLSKIQQEKISHTISRLTSRQIEVQKNQQDLKVQLENAENSFCDLISKDKDFNKYILMIKETIQKAEKKLYQEKEKEELNDIIQTTTMAFIPELERIRDKKFLFDDIVKPTQPNLNQENTRGQVNKKIKNYCDENQLQLASQKNQMQLKSGRNTKSMMNEYENLNVRKSQRLPLRNISKNETPSESSAKIGKAPQRESVWKDLTSAYLNAPLLHNRQNNFCF